MEKIQYFFAWCHNIISFINYSIIQKNPHKGGSFYSEIQNRFTGCSTYQTQLGE